MSIAASLKATLAAAIALTWSTAEAGQTMAAAEIEQAFRGITLDGIYHDGSFFTETYFDDGSVRYHDALGADSGDWWVRDNMFCTYYEMQQGSCFFVVRDGDNCFTFFEPKPGPDGAVVPRETWTSRGWNHEHEATCAKPPEAVT